MNRSIASKIGSVSLLIILATSCASYTEDIAVAQGSISSGEPAEAIRILNKKMGIENVRQVPPKLKGNDTLLLLERATLLQATNNYKMSARDMVVIDRNLEWLDIDRLNAADIGKYFYSADATNYRAPPYERLMLNTLNMINFLAMRDLDGAKVEARRFTIMELYYLDKDGKALMPGILALGNYLGGASFEAVGDYEMAARYYSRAWHFGLRDEDLRQRLTDLYRVSGYRGRELKSPFFEQLRVRVQAAAPLTWEEYATKHRTGDTLIVVQYGMVPYKQAQRVPARRAMAVASNMRGKHAITTKTRTRTAALISSGSGANLNFPVLTSTGLPGRTNGSASLTIDGKRHSLFLGMHVSNQVEQAWQQISGPLMSAALTRMITRAAIGQVGNASGQVAKTGGGGAVVGALGWLAASSIKAGMNAADTPDTRGWTTLPAYIRLKRTKLSRGLHQAEIKVSNRTDKQTIAVWPDRLNIANFSKIR